MKFTTASMVEKKVFTTLWSAEVVEVAVPGKEQKNQTGYILVRTRWKTSVRNVKAMPEHTMDQIISC